ncbi:MAG: polysaccharide ABC transporter ATP-binding protein [Eubacteriales bacterium]
MDEIAIKIEHVSKEYRLGAIGGGTLRGDLQSWWARVRGREDPNSKIGSGEKHIGERFLALDDISFEVRKGEALGIIGHNGAGKSTLLKLLSRVTAPTEGTISYNGRIASMLEVGTGFHPELTGRENVYMNGAILGMTKAEIDRKFDKIVEFAEMEKFIDTPVKRYSSGMYVKLAFAVAAHLDSEIMVMDEVLAVGDMKFQQKCLGKMGDAAGSEGRTVLYVSHNMNTIRLLCARCIVLDHGKLVFDGDTERAIEIYEDLSKNRNVAESYDAYERPQWLQRDDLRIRSARYVGKETNDFKPGEKIRIQFTVLYTRQVEKLGLRYEILTLSGLPIATAVTEELPIMAGERLQQFTMEYSVDGLVAGDYKCFFTFYSHNGMGGNKDVDCVPGLQFSVSGDHDDMALEWRPTYWGYVKLPAARLLDNEVRE